MSACTNCIKHYHDHFHGDTYDACARCGGKCEKFKISTLMPDEKTFMAEKLEMSVSVLEEKYLSRIDTPYGMVDVLKMKDGCNFLDEEYHCTAIRLNPYFATHTPSFSAWASAW
jgi:Fe-S-cluster containining protein